MLLDNLCLLKLVEYRDDLSRRQEGSCYQVSYGLPGVSVTLIINDQAACLHSSLQGLSEMKIAALMLGIWELLPGNADQSSFKV